jgi:hypothetical protein
MTGSGTALDPYIIQDVTDLQNMNLNLAAYYELGNDIDASATSGWNGGAGFIPLGQRGGTSFTGHFDGNNHTISNLYINMAPAIDKYTGLFGSAAGAEIRNVNLIGAYIEGGGGSGYFAMGILAGYLGSCTIGNCHVQGTVVYHTANTMWEPCCGGFCGWLALYSTVACCSSDVTISSSGVAPAPSGEVKLGGFIGNSDVWPNIAHCYVTGTVTRIDGGRYIGGFCGWNWSTISKCYADVDIEASAAWQWIGGFVGTNYAIMNNCYSRGSVHGPPGDPWTGRTGGFAGKLSGDGSTYNCYSTGAVTAPSYVGGFCAEGPEIGECLDCFWDTQTSGMGTSSCGTGKTTAEMKTESTFTDAGWDFDAVWNIDGVTNDGYPFLQWPQQPIAQSLPAINIHAKAGTARVNGKVTDTGSSLLSCQYRFRYKIYGGTYNYTAWANGKSTNNTFYVDLAGLSSGQYEFSAQIRSLCSPSDWAEPLYFNLTKPAVTNCTVSGTISTLSPAIYTSYYFGGLIGRVDGVEVSECSADVDIILDDGYNIGGLIADILDSHISKCFEIGNISAGDDFGSFAYSINNNSIVDNCYALGDATSIAVTNYCVAGFVAYLYSGTINNCYSKGKVAYPGTYPAGFCSQNNGTITGCFWDMETSGRLTSQGGTGKTTVEMQSLDTFFPAGWNIEEHKSADLADGYPFLSWQIPGSSPIWYIFIPGVPVPPSISVVTLPATEIR